MTFKTLLFDLDATLYPAENGFWGEIGSRIELYLRERMGIDPTLTATLQKKYYVEYGTTLRGLQHHHPINPQDYLQFVHDIPVQHYLQPDPPLRALLRSLPQRKWIFTNSDHAHATRVLTALGLTDCFDGILSLESLDYECKPHPSVYQTALRLTHTPDPRQVLYLDDSLRNLAPAHALGMYTVHVGPALSTGNGAPPTFTPHLSILRPHDLLQAMPELFS
jgi:putative hydrolase of the HAD superfamily